MINKKNLFLASIFFCFFFNSNAQENNEKKNRLRFADKIIHSFGLQYNNVFHNKGKFVYRDAFAYDIGRHPCISYGREYIVKYNLTFPSGWGISAEFVAGNRDFMTCNLDKRTGKKSYSGFLWFEPLTPVLDYTYYGGQIKASYMYRLNEQITIQPETGIKLLKYKRGNGWSSVYQDVIADEFGRPVIIEQWRWFDISDRYVPQRFMPELTAGINFLFHSKKDLRHNFILGLNGTVGFIDRYAGWQRFTNTNIIDVSMRWGSSFFALNMGYEFTGFKKPLHKTKQYRKERNANMQFETFNFSKSIHSVGIYFTSGFSFKPRIKEAQGKFRPIMYNSNYVPELNIRYSLSVKNGLGFAIEVPVGLFQRFLYYSLGGLIPEETVWADGEAIGPGSPRSFGVMVYYAGVALKFSYLAQIHKNMFIQPETGIKFVPFIYPSRNFEQQGPMAENVYYIDYDGNPTDLVWLHDCPTVPQKNYAIPDITIAVNFMVHGKKPYHNFIFGINANIGLVNRISWEYHTTEVIPSELQSSGKYGLKSSYVGFHIGYQFMMANKSKKIPEKD